MSVHLQLIHNQGFTWHQRDGWHVKGYLFGDNNQYLQGDTLIEYVQKAGEPERWLGGINGHFIIIKETDNGVWAAVDKLRAFPLFYHQTKAGLVISDDAVWLQKASDLNNLNALASEQLRTLNSVTGNNTLFNGLNQLQAGQRLNFEGKALSVITYYQHVHQYNLKLNGTNDYVAALVQESNAVFERLINSLEGRPAIIPLSGGHDSRFIAAMLKKLKYPKVICYTYGRKDSPEVAVSKQVAQQLGFPWHFVEYTAELQETLMHEKGKAYRTYGAQYNSIAHEQDWFAVGSLLASGAIPKDGVVIPGYCGDFPAGSYLPKEITWASITTSISGLVDYIYQTHFTRTGSPKFKSAMLQLLGKELEGYTVTNRDEFVSVYEHWLTVNRLSRFIVNAVRVYEYYGLQWRMPLWDDGYVNLWYNIPNQYRKDRTLYKQFLNAYLFEPFGIEQNMNKVDGLFETDNLLTKIKAITPKPIRQGLKKLLIPENQIDANRQQWLSGRIYQEIEDKSVVVDPRALNHVHACWYLETIKHLTQTTEA
jgi:asparagine synthase (glutamine-hydrolysing)